MSDVDLYAAVQSRRRPEDVARICQETLKGELSIEQFRIIRKASSRASTQTSYGYTSMSQEFAAPVGAGQMMHSGQRLFPSMPALSAMDASSPVLLEQYVRDINSAIGKVPGRNDFAHDRLSHAQRRDYGLTMSRRQYNKQFRFAMHLEWKLRIMQREWRKYEFTRIGKSKLATKIGLDGFTDVRTGCFIAYYASRCNLRSIFTNGQQERPFDEICEMLLELCRKSQTTDWWAIAHIFPDQEVLSHLTQEQKGKLLAQWFEVLADIADFLQELADGTAINRSTMIVRRGNDSTTWNNTASAWNKAREGWFAVLQALKMESVLDELCPGKVPRLMAADVAAWHRSTGGGLHPDTKIWAELPAPWSVMRGEVACTRSMVEDVCRRHGLNPEPTGWTAPRPRGKAVQFKPTPELVHGVVVGSPIMAKILRDAGYFSGKPSKSGAPTEKSQLN